MTYSKLVYVENEDNISVGMLFIAYRGRITIVVDFIVFKFNMLGARLE